MSFRAERGILALLVEGPASRPGCQGFLAPLGMTMNRLPATRYPSPVSLLACAADGLAPPYLMSRFHPVVTLALVVGISTSSHAQRPTSPIGLWASEGYG